MRLNVFSFFPESESLVYAKTVLFIDNDQAQLSKFYALLK